MKKLILFLLSVVIVIAVAAIPSESQAEGLTLSVEHERVFNREMVYENGRYYMNVGDFYSESGDYVGEGNSIANPMMDASKTFLKASYAIHSRIDAFIKLGTATVDYSYDYISDITEKETFHGDHGDFAWGVGAEAMLVELNKIKISASGEYVTYKTDGRVKIDGVDAEEFIDSYTSSMKVREWNAALKASTTMGIFEPFAGVRYSDVKLENEISAHGEEFGIPYSIRVEQEASAEKNWGVLLGTKVSLSDSLFLNIEGRYFDETALKAGIAYNF